MKKYFYKKRILLPLLSLVLLFLFLGFKSESKQPSQAEVFFTVKSGALRVDVAGSANIENTKQVRIRSQVDGNQSLIYLIAEGSQVQPGDLLFELDPAVLQEKIAEHKIRVATADASYIQAREEHGVTENTGLSNIERNRIGVKLAQLDLEKYLEGEYPQQIQQAQNAIILSQEELQRSQDKLIWSEKLANEGFVTRSELVSDSLEVKRREINLKVAQTEMTVFKKYSHIRKLEGLKSELYQSQQSLIRAEKDARADLIRSSANLSRRESECLREKNRLNYFKEQLENCKIYSPAAGMVIYASSVQNNRNREPLEEGQQIRNQQEMIYIPKGGKMKAVFKIREADLPLVQLGMPAVVSVDALSGLTLSGVVKKIAPLPDRTSVWLNPDLKLFRCEVLLDSEMTALRAGMSGSVEVIIKDYTAVTYIPVQAVVKIDGQATVFIRSPSNEIMQQVIQPGLANNQMLAVLSGLKAGDQVLINPPLSHREWAVYSPANNE